MSGGCKCALAASGLGAGLTLFAPGLFGPGSALAIGPGADATGPIQRAVDALPSAGGTVALPPGHYLLASGSLTGSRFPSGRSIRSAVVVNRDHVRIEGSPGRTILELAPGTKMRAITLTGKDDTLTGLTVEGNGRRRKGAPWPGGDVVDALVYASGARDLTVTHCDVSGGIEDGIGAYRTSGVAVRDNTVHDNGTPAAGAVGIAIYSDGASVSGNTVVRNSAAGVLVDPRSSSVQITSNRIDANAKEGVVLGGTDITVEDNQVDDNGADRYAAVSINGGHAVTIAGNSVTDNRYGGIAVQNGSGGRASDVTLTGNRVTGNGSSPTDQIIVEPGERVNANWHSVNTVRFSPSLTGWPFGLLAGVVALAGTGAYIDAWHRRTKRAR